MATKTEILGKLEKVMDPELGINIVDLGLIYKVAVEKKEGGRPQKAYVEMTFTTPACPLLNMILNDVKERLDELPGMDIEVKVVFDPPWTPDRMSEKAKIKLGML
ncbi:MAG: metal-sulfur cluster assembly factor [Candidatus Micrarchaeota archaeon]